MNDSSFFTDSLRKVPLNLREGAVFRSAMPCYKSFRPEVDLKNDLALLKVCRISQIVLLAEDHECEFVTGTNLKEKYGENGFCVIPFPIPAGTLPDQAALSHLLDKIQEEAAKGQNIAIHCQKGCGRTGVVSACLAARILKLSGKSAIEHIKLHVPDAIENQSQIDYITSFCQKEQQALFKKSITPLPFEFEKGSLFRSQMPGYMQTDKDIDHDIEVLKEQGITHVVLLATDKDCQKHSGKDLKSAYESTGLSVMHFPIPDFGTPDKNDLSLFFERVEGALKAGANLVVHCTAGKGRTGLFLSCLARKVFGLQGKEAVLWVRESIPGAVETTSQKTFIDQFVSDQPPSLFSQSLVYLPLAVHGGMLYRSVMPGSYAESSADKENVKKSVLRDILTLKVEGISEVLMLMPEEEVFHCLGVNLQKEYADHGIKVHYLPIKEGEVPDQSMLKTKLAEVLKTLSGGNRVAIHCRLGQARTGLVVACLAKSVKKLNSDQAMKWVERSIPGATFKPLQKEFIRLFVPDDKCSVM